MQLCINNCYPGKQPKYNLHSILSQNFVYLSQFV